MFNFLENDEILKAKRKQKEKEYRDELLFQIQENKIRKLKENIKSKNKKPLNIKLIIENDKTFFNKGNNKHLFDLKRINSSIDNINLFHNKRKTKLSLNDKFSSLKNLIGIAQNKNRNNNNFNNMRISTEFNTNKDNFKSTLFKLNRNKIINTDNNINLMKSNKHIMKKSLSQMLKNFSISRNNIIKNKINSINYDLMNEIDIQFLFKGFVDQQIKTINDFASNLEDIFYFQYKNKDNLKSFNSLIINEKNKAMKNIENSKNKLKQKFGFFPMEKIYDSRIEQLFNKIINKITSIYSSISLTKIDNYLNKSNSNNNILKNKDFEFYEINETTPNKYNYSKSIDLFNNFNPSNKKFNFEEDFNFFDFWKNKYKNEIIKEKNKKLNINETIKFDNYWNNKKQENLAVFPANNFLKNVKFRNINNINKNEKKNNGMKLPYINLKEKFLKKRNFSANHKSSEGFF